MIYRVPRFSQSQVTDQDDRKSDDKLNFKFQVQVRSKVGIVHVCRPARPLGHELQLHQSAWACQKSVRVPRKMMVLRGGNYSLALAGVARLLRQKESSPVLSSQTRGSHVT